MIDQVDDQKEEVSAQVYPPNLPDESPPRTAEGTEVIPPFPDRFGAFSPPPVDKTSPPAANEAGVSPPGIEPPPPPPLEEILPTSPFEGVLGKLKKILPIFLALIVIIGLVSLGIRFFKGRQELSKKEVVLTYWGLWEPASVIETVIIEYQKKHPNVKINYSQESA